MCTTTADHGGAKSWDEHVADLERLATSEGFTALRDEILALAELEPGDRVLDIGAGTGLLALAAAPSVSHVDAVDVSAEMCRHLSDKLARQPQPGNVAVHQGNATRLPIPDGSIDVVVSNYCFHHLSDPDKRRALDEVRRVLTPGGRLVFGDMMFRVGLASARDRAVIGSFAWRMLRRGPAGLLRLARTALRQLTGSRERPASVAWWRAALHDAGFEAIRAWPLDHEGGIAAGRIPR